MRIELTNKRIASAFRQALEHVPPFNFCGVDRIRTCNLRLLVPLFYHSAYAQTNSRTPNFKSGQEGTRTLSLSADNGALHAIELLDRKKQN